MARRLPLALLVTVALLLSARSAASAEEPSIEKPVEPARKLVLEDALRPGTMLDVADYRGRPVLLRGMCPE